MLGRLVHYSFDALMLSALLAGIKRTTGLSPDLERLSDPTARGIAEKYVGLGEFVFDSSVAAARASQYFNRTSITEQLRVEKEKQKVEETAGGWFK